MGTLVFEREENDNTQGKQKNTIFLGITELHGNRFSNCVRELIIQR